MKKIINIVFVLAVISALIGFLFFSTDIVAGLPITDPTGQGQCAGYPNGICESCQTPNSCSGKDATPPNPDRNYFDGWGNEFTYNGTLISVGSCDSNTPSGVNPYCPVANNTQTTATVQPFIGK